MFGPSLDLLQVMYSTPIPEEGPDSAEVLPKCAMQPSNVQCPSNPIGAQEHRVGVEVVRSLLKKSSEFCFPVKVSTKWEQ